MLRFRASFALRCFWACSLSGICVVPWQVKAASLEEQRQALALIREAANDFCTTRPLETTTNSVKLTGNAKAKLDGVLAKVAELGVEGAADIRRDSSKVGLLQADVASALRDVDNCKLSIFNTLQNKMIPAPRSDIDDDKGVEKARNSIVWSESARNGFDWDGQFTAVFVNRSEHQIKCVYNIRGVIRSRDSSRSVLRVSESKTYNLIVPAKDTQTLVGVVGVRGFTTDSEVVAVAEDLICP